MADRLPPPPFWRTRYYDEEVSRRPDRQDIAADEILAAIAAPVRCEIQPNGRIRHWRLVAAIGRWLRVVTEADGETVHNVLGQEVQRMTERHEAVRYFVEQDMMAIEIRPWPGKPGEHGEGYDAGPDLVIHVYPGDGAAWLWEIENASQHPEHIAAALIELRRRHPASAATQ